MRAVNLLLWSALFHSAFLVSPASAAPADPAAGAPTSSSYTVKPLSQLAIYPESRVAAQVVPDNESRIAAEVGARIEAIPVKLGQAVRKGEVLVRLDARQYQLALEQANSQVNLLGNRYKLAQIQFDSAKALHESKFISQQLLDQRRTELEVVGSELKIAQNNASQARLSLDKTILRAPFAGAVRERLAGEGELAVPGQPIITLVEHGRNELRARVANRDIPEIKAAKSLSFAQGGRVFPVKIARIAPVIDARAQTRDVILKADTELVSGSSGELQWASTRAHLPAAYLQQRDGRLGVWIEEQGKPIFRLLPEAQIGRPVPLSWSLDTRIVDEGRFVLAAPTPAQPASTPSAK